MCLRERPRWFGSSPLGPWTFVAITSRSREGPKSFNARPRISSLTPFEYTSAVSKKLMPASRARRRKGRLSSSSSTHSRHFFEPYVIAPRHRRDTFSPVEPSRVYSMTLIIENQGGDRWRERLRTSARREVG